MVPKYNKTNFALCFIYTETINQNASFMLGPNSLPFLFCLHHCSRFFVTHDLCSSKLFTSRCTKFSAYLCFLMKTILNLLKNISADLIVIA